MSQSQLLYPKSSVIEQGVITRARLANAKLRLYKQGLTPTFSTTLSELNANECDFDGYPPGGVLIATWSAPTFGPGESAMINAGFVNFAFPSGGPGIGNVVGGFYVHTADNVLWIVAQFPDGFPMQIPGAGLPLAVAIGFGSG